jgi:5'-nucleotidase
MKGALLTQVLEAGQKNIGLGGFLDYSAFVSYDEATKRWSIKGQPIEEEKTYKVALLDFLLTGGEVNLGFLTKSNPGITKVYPTITDLTDPRSDVRLAIIRYMEKIK